MYSCVCVHVCSYLETDGLPADCDLKRGPAGDGNTRPGRRVFISWGRAMDLSANLKQKKSENNKKKKKKNVHSTTFVKQKDDLNFDWRAICDRRLSCPTLLSPIILFHFRKL